MCAFAELQFYESYLESQNMTDNIDHDEARDLIDRPELALGATKELRGSVKVQRTPRCIAG